MSDDQQVRFRSLGGSIVLGQGEVHLRNWFRRSVLRAVDIDRIDRGTGTLPAKLGVLFLWIRLPLATPQGGATRRFRFVMNDGHIVYSDYRGVRKDPAPAYLNSWGAHYGIPVLLG